MDPPPPLTCHNPMYACSINCGVKCKIYHHENKLYKMAGGCDEKISEKYKYTHVKYTHDSSRRRISEDAAPHFFVWLIYLRVFSTPHPMPPLPSPASTSLLATPFPSFNISSPENLSLSLTLCLHFYTFSYVSAPITVLF